MPKTYIDISRSRSAAYSSGLQAYRSPRGGSSSISRFAGEREAFLNGWRAAAASSRARGLTEEEAPERWVEVWGAQKRPPQMVSNLGAALELVRQALSELPADAETYVIGDCHPYVRRDDTSPGTPTQNLWTVRLPEKRI